jgi:DNA-binding PadR family transcriptional regulator
MFGRHQGRGCGDRRFARDPAGWGRGTGGHRHWGGGFRSRRLFDHGDLRYITLQLIAEKPRHGYEVIKAIEERLGGLYSPSPGVVYPTLTLLEELGYVTAAAEGSKKLYTVTPEGTAFLEANRATVDALFARMDEASRTYGGGPPPEILRAMQNLRLALGLRLRKGPLTEEQLRAVTAALDRVAGEIERG